MGKMPSNPYPRGSTWEAAWERLLPPSLGEYVVDLGVGALLYVSHITERWQWVAAAALVRVGCCWLLAPVGTAQLVYHDLWGYHSSWYQASHRQFVAYDLALPARCCDLVAVP